MSGTRVDDRSSTITFAGGWGRGGAPTDYNSSLTYATIGGQSATLTFRGTGVSVYGHIMAQAPGVPSSVSTYSIDGGNPTTFTESQDGTEHPNQQFYQSPVLSNGQHTIVVTYPYNNHAALYFDYFLVVVGSDPPSPTPTPTPPPPPIVTTVVSPPTPSRSSSSTTTTTIGSSSAISSIISSSSSPRNISISTSMVNGTVVTVTVIPSSGSPSGSNSLSTSPSSTISPNSVSASSNFRIHPGIIIGSCVGGFVTIVLSAILVYCCLRRRRREYDWRKVSGFSSQPYSSEWHQQAGRVQSKLSRSPTQPTESQLHDHSTYSGRPPSYSQEPPSYNPAQTPSSSTHSPLPSKLTGSL